MKRNRTYNAIFRRTVTSAAALALLLSCVPNVGETWAWFNDNQNADVGGIQSASFAVTLSIAKTDEENTSVEVTQKDGAYTAQLARGSAYTVTLDTGASTVSKAYCEIYSNELNAVTNDIIRNGEGHTDYSFTIDLQEYEEKNPSASEGEEPLPAIPPKSEETANEEDNTSDSGNAEEGSTSDSGNADENTSGNDTVEGEGSADEGQTVIEDPAVPLTDAPETVNTVDFIEFTFVPHWGANPFTGNTAAVGFAMDVGFGSGPMIIADGDVVNEWGEPIDPNMVLVTPPAETEASGPAYVAVSEHAIPLYFQNDYPDIRYGAGSVATSGCGIISLAMIANYMTGYTYDPVDLARWFGGRAENNIQRMLIGAETLGIPYTEAANIDEMTAALYSGKIVVMMQDGFRFENPFTTSQHFIVICGITEDGRYLILDPNKPNYDKWQLKEGFEKGFTRSALAQGYSGSWIFDPEAIPEDYVPYHKEEPPRQDNYPGLELTYEEQELLAKLIWAEARGECAEGQQAVAEVVLNRLVSGKYQNSIKGIIYAEGQFNGVEKMEEAEPWQAQYDAIDAARYGVPVLEKDVFYFGTAPHNDNIFKQIGGHIFCYVDSSTAESEVETETDMVEEETDVTESEVQQPEVETQEQPEPEIQQPENQVQPEPEIQQPETQEPEYVDPQPEETDVPELGDEDYEGPGLNVRNYYQTEETEAEDEENAAEPIDSGLVSLAMVASYITRHEYLPATLEAWFAGQGENSSQRLGIAADTLKLPWIAAEDISHITNAIADGNLVILMMDGTEEANIFTDKEHFIVLRGVTEDGKYLVNDPDKLNYGKDELLSFYENGFDLETISAVYHSAWIFNPNSLPEDFVPYEQELTAPAANQEVDAQVSDEEQSETSE